MKNGDKIRVLQMEDHNGMDTQAIRMNGKTYTVDYLDDAGQIHLQESGLAVIPDVDSGYRTGQRVQLDSGVRP